MLPWCGEVLFKLRSAEECSNEDMEDENNEDKNDEVYGNGDINMDDYGMC